MLDLDTLISYLIENLEPRTFSTDEAIAIGTRIGIDWPTAGFSSEEFRQGLVSELEHLDVTGGDPDLTGKIAWAHLKEDPKYYTKLNKAGL